VNEKLTKMQFSLYKMSGTTNGMDIADDCCTDHPFVDDTKNAGRRTFPTLFKKDRFLDLMIVNFENATSHKHIVQKRVQTQTQFSHCKSTVAKLH